MEDEEDRRESDLAVSRNGRSGKEAEWVIPCAWAVVEGVVEIVEFVLDDRRRPLHRDSGLLSSSLLSSSHMEDMGGPGMDCDALWEDTESDGLGLTCGRANELSDCVFMGDQLSMLSTLGTDSGSGDLSRETDASGGGMSESYRWVGTGVRLDIISWL